MEEALHSFLQKLIPNFERLEEVERLSGGASQETYRLRVVAGGNKKTFAFRRAFGGNAPQQSSSPWDKITTHQEARLMELAKRYGVPEPQVLGLTATDDKLGEGFLMEWLEGETLGKKILSDESLAKARSTLAFQCGEILATIHAIPLEEVEAFGLPTQPTAEVLSHSYQVYKNMGITRPMLDYAARWLKENQPPEPKLCLTHNDFRNGNLMVAPSGLVAVLDWELAALSAPMRDLGWLCANCWRFGGEAPVGGFGAYEDLFAGYRSAGGEALLDIQAVKFWEVMSSFRWAIMCLGMAQIWQTGADRSVERAAIGRRASESELDCANLLLGKSPFTPLPETAKQKDTMPTKEELIEAVRDYLLDSRKAMKNKRDRFLALVAANSLDIVQRELATAPALAVREQENLEAILQQKGGRAELRKMLANKITKSELSLEDEEVKNYLREQTLAQVLIDQPTYSGVRDALG